MMKRHKSKPRGLRERGAILVEFVIVVPLFMTLVLGIFEIGKAWEANQTVVQAARGGARTAAQLGQNPLSDQQAVLAVVSTFGADFGDVQLIRIYQADANGDWSGSCSTAADNCNEYSGTAITNANDATNFDCSSPSKGSNWCPTVRNNSQRTAAYLGVYVEFTEQYQTGFFGGGTYTMSERTIMRIEPDAQ